MLTKLKKLLSSGTSKDAAISMTGNVFIAAAGMAFSIITARALSPDRFGVFSALFSFATILGSLGDVGTSSALINFLPKQPENRRQIISISFWVQLTVGLILLLLSASLIPFRSIFFPGSDSIHFVILGILALALSIETFAIAVFRAEKKFLWSSLTAVLDSVLKILLTLAFFITKTIDVTTVLISALVASTIAALFGASSEFKAIRFIFPKAKFTEIFTFAKWAAITQSFSVFIGRIDTVLLNALDNSYSAGIFAAASRVSLVFVLLVSTLGAVVSPRFSGFNKKEHVLSYLKKLLLLIGVVALTMFLCFIFAPQIITLVFGNEYIPAIPVFRALILAMIPFLFTIATVNPIIYTYNRPDFIAKTTIIQVLILVSINVLLIPTLGPLAPSIALGVSNLTTLALTSWKLFSLLK